MYDYDENENESDNSDNDRIKSSGSNDYSNNINNNNINNNNDYNGTNSPRYYKNDRTNTTEAESGREREREPELPGYYSSAVAILGLGEEVSCVGSAYRTQKAKEKSEGGEKNGIAGKRRVFSG